MNLLKKKIITGILLIIAFSIGYIRETSFLIINNVLSGYELPNTPSYLQPPSYLYEMNTSNLISLKWGLTFFFSLVFTVLTLLIIHVYFKTKSYNRITIAIYSILFFVAFLIALIGIILGQLNSLYTISRFIAGLLQYPLLSLIIFTFFYFFNRLPKSNKIT